MAAATKKTKRKVYGKLSVGIGEAVVIFTVGLLLGIGIAQLSVTHWHSCPAVTFVSPDDSGSITLPQYREDVTRRM